MLKLLPERHQLLSTTMLLFGALFFSSLEFLMVHCWEAMLQDKPLAVPDVATYCIYIYTYIYVPWILLGGWVLDGKLYFSIPQLISKTQKFHCHVFPVGNFLQISFPANFVSLPESASPQNQNLKHANDWTPSQKKDSFSLEIILFSFQHGYPLVN